MLRTTQQFVDVLGAADGSLRATQQVADILAQSAPGGLRVEQQYVMVLVPAPSTFRLELTSVLGVSQDTRVNDPHVRLSTLLNLQQTAPATFRRVAFSVMEWLQKASRTYTESALHTLEVEDTWLVRHTVGEHFPTFTNLSLAQTLNFEVGLFLLTVSTLALSDTLTFQGPVARKLRSNLRLTSEVPFQDQFARAASALNLLQRAGQAWDESVDSVLELIDEVFRTFTPQQLLNLSQTVEFAKITEVVTELLLTHNLDFTTIRSRLPSHTLELAQSLLSFYRGLCDTKAYGPLEGSSTDPSQPTPPPKNLPTSYMRPDGGGLRLSYPATGEACSSLLLRAPNSDNKDRQTFTRINRESLGGALTIFADPNWPKLHTLLLSFSGLSEAHVESLHTFMLESLGKTIALHDWEGRHWTGIIITPGDQIVADGPQGFTATFEFQGQLVESPGTGACISFNQHVDVTVE